VKLYTDPGVTATDVILAYSPPPPPVPPLLPVVPALPPDPDPHTSADVRLVTSPGHSHESVPAVLYVAGLATILLDPGGPVHTLPFSCASEFDPLNDAESAARPGVPVHVIADPPLMPYANDVAVDPSSHGQYTTGWLAVGSVL
jgi:hypothetical protein